MNGINVKDKNNVMLAGDDDKLRKPLVNELFIYYETYPCLDYVEKDFSGKHIWGIVGNILYVVVGSGSANEYICEIRYVK